ncbi:MAG: chromosomal replication initiator DnaA [Marinosulfonomonas sp.]|nr:chromosomal replication initiator DnaA [Marinosulfonomonas sp.]
MSHQLTFDLPSRTALGREAFFVSPANAMAVKTIEEPDNWPDGKLVLVGPKGAGKTHLAHVWAQMFDAPVLNASRLNASGLADQIAHHTHIALEDIDKLAGEPELEKTLFHLHNMVLATQGRLLMTSATPPGNCTFALADLTSRIHACTSATLQPADDQLLAAILVKLFDDRQLDVSPDVISYLVTRIDRSFSDAQNIVTTLDRAALSARRAITRPFVIQVMDKLSRKDA